MAKTRKLLSVLASFSLVASMFPAAAFGAVNGEEAAENSASTSTNTPIEAADEGEFSESIDADENPEAFATELEQNAGVQTLAEEGTGNLVVAVDVGHGYSDAGAVSIASEAEANRRIADALIAELKTYAGVTVIETYRGYEGYCSSRKERIQSAVEQNADVVVSVHCNSATSDEAHGSEVWIESTETTYNAAAAQKSSSLGQNILNKLVDLGMTNRGLKYRYSSDTKYENGDAADYLGINYYSRLANIPGIIVEHAFVNNEEDAAKLNSEEWCQKFGVADAQGIAAEYGLQKKFSDVSLDSWSADYVYKAYTLGFMQGSGASFRPTDTVTRGEVATIIYRAKTGASTSEASAKATANTFADVEDEQYYTRAINWCYSNGYMEGYGKDDSGLVIFGTEQPISREELATVAYRVAGQPTAGSTAAYDAAIDLASVSDFATSALKWTAENDILSGKNTDSGKMLDPQGNTTREEASKIFVNSYDYLQGYSIMGTSQKTAAQMAAAFNRSGHTYPSADLAQYGAETIERFCEILVEEADFEGVRAEVVFAQAMKETGWLQFGGDVKINQCNFCGLGATGNGEPGADFSTGWGTENGVRAGLRAQIQHLMAYATTATPKNTVIDPRYTYVTKGISPYVEGLGGRWAVGYQYGVSIVSMINDIK
jgi:N-acetylmuramoyl-L-alanine amidase